MFVFGFPARGGAGVACSVYARWLLSEVPCRVFSAFGVLPKCKRTRCICELMHGGFIVSVAPKWLGAFGWSVGSVPRCTCADVGPACLPALDRFWTWRFSGQGAQLRWHVMSGFGGCRRQQSVAEQGAIGVGCVLCMCCIVGQQWHGEGISCLCICTCVSA